MASTEYKLVVNLSQFSHHDSPVLGGEKHLTPASSEWLQSLVWVEWAQSIRRF